MRCVRICGGFSLRPALRWPESSQGMRHPQDDAGPRVRARSDDRPSREPGRCRAEEGLSVADVPNSSGTAMKDAALVARPKVGGDHPSGDNRFKMLDATLKR